MPKRFDTSDRSAGPTRRLSMDDALGLSKLPKLRSHPAVMQGMETMTFGELFIEALNEYVDAKHDYIARARAGEIRSESRVERAAQRLRALLEQGTP